MEWCPSCWRLDRHSSCNHQPGLSFKSQLAVEATKSQLFTSYRAHFNLVLFGLSGSGCLDISTWSFSRALANIHRQRFFVPVILVVQMIFRQAMCSVQLCAECALYLAVRVTLLGSQPRNLLLTQDNLLVSSSGEAAKPRASARMFPFRD